MSTAKPFSKAAEEKLLKAAKEMTAHVEGDQMPPDAAIAKVASARNLPPEWLGLLVQAHNHGRATYQRGHSTGLLDKLAEFPLASVDGVKRILYPDSILSPGESEEKTAVDDEYQRNSGWAAEHYKAEKLAALRQVKMEKTAEAKAIPRDPDAVMTEKFRGISKLAAVAEACRHRVRQSKVAYMAAMGQLADFYKRPENAKDFAKHACWATELFGPVAKFAMEYVQARNRMRVGEIIKPASDGQPVLSDREPYSLVQAAIKAGETMIDNQKRASKAEVRRKQAHDEVFRPFVQAPAEAPSPSPGSHKEGNLLSGMGGGLGFSLMRGTLGGPAQEFSDQAQSPADLAQRLVGDLADPSHEQTIRQIQVRAMLTDMLANDEVISGYDPDEVIQAYNEIASLSPRASMQSAVMRPLLRKRLAAGAVEPFEAQQMAEIEKTIRQTEIPPRERGSAHGSQLLAD